MAKEVLIDFAKAPADSSKGRAYTALNATLGDVAQHALGIANGLTAAETDAIVALDGGQARLVLAAQVQNALSTINQVPGIHGDHEIADTDLTDGAGGQAD